MKTYDYLLNTIEQKGAAYLILIDPDSFNEEKLSRFVRHCSNSGVDGFLVGGSLLLNGDIENCIKIVKENTSLPAIIFPGDVSQVYKPADAILFFSVSAAETPSIL